MCVVLFLWIVLSLLSRVERKRNAIKLFDKIAAKNALTDYFIMYVMKL